MVKTAKQTTSDCDNVTILQSDCTKMDSLSNDTLDIVIQSFMFHHLNDTQKRAAISEIYRVLKPNGIFYFVDWVKPESLYSKIAFNIIKIVDGFENLASHENNAVIKMVEEKLILVEKQAIIETSLGTVAIILFKKN